MIAVATTLSALGLLRKRQADREQSDKEGFLTTINSPTAPFRVGAVDFDPKNYHAVLDAHVAAVHAKFGSFLDGVSVEVRESPPLHCRHRARFAVEYDPESGGLVFALWDKVAERTHALARTAH